jgi:hypothetical protein
MQRIQLWGVRLGLVLLIGPAAVLAQEHRLRRIAQSGSRGKEALGRTVSAQLLRDHDVDLEQRPLFGPTGSIRSWAA